MPVSTSRFTRQCLKTVPLCLALLFLICQGEAGAQHRVSYEVQAESGLLAGYIETKFEDSLSQVGIARAPRGKGFYHVQLIIKLVTIQEVPGSFILATTVVTQDIDNEFLVEEFGCDSLAGSYTHLGGVFSEFFPKTDANVEDFTLLVASTLKDTFRQFDEMIFGSP
ncbi:hypothetical protein [Desulfocurvibacter africanus]|uniref:Lipoprotein n=1 Tax=Desulfocurvibacter africanus subsp. africanus str. Walvis Bay TaxID=690850 RepID=F3YXE3_DESAF|nr:hypothetical protein [Desulfocurvibacter africanus]EGJ51720.1 hypothetical protein Desaf_3434 [Desulfocurvibacter africanus subsp. africanus str. Walvis Bay]